MNAFVGNPDTVQIQFLEFREVLQIFQPFIGDERAHHGQAPQLLHARKARHHVVGDVGVVQVERLHVDERSQRRGTLDGDQADPEILQLRQRRQPFEPLLFEAKVRQTSQASLELHQLFELAK